MTPRQRRVVTIAAIVWWLVILALLPFGRAIVDALRSRSLLVLCTTAGFGAVMVLLAVGGVLLRRAALVEPTQWLFALMMSAVVIVLVQLLPRAEERWHVVQYGILGVLCWAAVPSDKRWRVAWAVLLVGSMGWIDEGIQLLLPNRVYDWLDVMLNAGSGLAGAGIPALSGRLASTRGAARSAEVR
ncbi:MAG: VanZ family protein [Myxococcota bacterium]